MTKDGSQNRRARALAAASFLVVLLTAAASSNASSLRLTSRGQSSSVTGPPPGNDLFTWYDTSLGDNIIRLVNPNGCADGALCGAETNLCAMFYVFDADQEMGECCGIPITPSQMETFSVTGQLTSNWALAGTNDTNGVIAVVGSGINDSGAGGGCGNPNAGCNGGCNPTLPPATTGSINLLGGILHNDAFLGVTRPTETSLFNNGAGDPGNNAYLVEQCAALIGNSTGAGACSLLPPPPPPPTPAFLYVNNDDFPVNQISAFKVFPDGTLSPVPGGPFPTGGFGTTCFDIDSAGSSTIALNQTLYATDPGSGDVSAQRINGDGTLTNLGTFLDSAGSFPVGVATSINGQFLFVGDGFSVPPGAGLGIDTFGINSDGTLSFLGMSPAGQYTGFDVIFDPKRDNVISNSGFDHVSVLKIGGGGTLTPLGLSPYPTPTNDDHKMALRSQGDCLFVAGGVFQTNQAVAFEVDAAGNLTPAPGSPYLLSGATFVIGTATVPSGRFVYFGTDAGIFGFSVGASCALTPVPGSPENIGGLAAGLTTDNVGAFLFDVDSEDFVVNSFGIASNGSLSPLSQQPLQGTAGAGMTTCVSGLTYVQP
jgi:hypothetical protein